MKTKFEIQGIEMLEKEVKHYDKQASRVLVPMSWKRVAIVRLE